MESISDISDIYVLISHYFLPEVYVLSDDIIDTYLVS
jgi:hypothetical protein